MKRKVEKQESSTPAPLSAISAVAARRARQQQQPQAGISHGVTTESTELEHPNKRARSSPETSTDVTLSKRGRAVATAVGFDSNIANTEDNLNGVAKIDDQAVIAGITGEEDEDDLILSNNADRASLPRKSAVASENFILSRNRLRKSDIVYSDEHTLCVRLKEKMTLVLIGIYDIWVKRGVVSLMGAKLHPSTKTYRVYAPSTHSLPVIKCVSGVEGSAEIELQSCSCGLQKLKELSPNFSRIWNSTKTPGDSITVDGSFKRSFSVIYTSSDDLFNRPLRPLHLEKKWSTTIKTLSGRAHSLRVLLCGPKGAGKSTFGRYLLNHLLTPAPDASCDQMNDGVAYLDLDPGQPEFATMGNIYLAHLREPCFGPPFSHPNLRQNSRLGKIVRCHHIGATSPKEDPDNYAVCIMNLLDGYRSLTATYTRCPLIINFPGWIFGLGLEVATWIIRSTGLSDVIYMSEKGPEEVIQPLAAAATEAGVILTTLPSQPVEMVTRSSAQLRSMQMQSYFHTIQSEEESHPFWTDVPITRHKPIRVSYSGSRPGIAGIMVLGNRYSPSVLRDIVDGSVVAVVAVEQASAIPSYAGNEANQSGDNQSVEGEINMMDSSYANDNNDEDADDGNGGEDGISELQDRQLIQSLLNDSIVRCPASDLPYLAWGAGSSIPLDPKASRCLGLAFVRSIDVTSQHLELISPLPSSVIRDAIRQGHSLVLVRGMTDSPDWAFSEEYYAARNAEQDFMTRMSQIKTGSRKRTEKDAEETTQQQQQQRDGHLQKLQERVRSASRLPYLKVIDDASSLHQTDNRQETGTWRLRKKVYISSDSELD